MLTESYQFGFTLYTLCPSHSPFSLSLSRLQVFFNTYGIQTQTPQQVEPIQIWPQKELVKVTRLSIIYVSLHKSLRRMAGGLEPTSAACGPEPVFTVGKDQSNMLVSF